MATAIEIERGRHAIWRDELRARAKADGLTDVERDTLRRGIRDHVRQITVFDAMGRMIERVRCDSYILARFREIDEEARQADTSDAPIEGDQ